MITLPHAVPVSRFATAILWIGAIAIIYATASSFTPHPFPSTWRGHHGPLSNPPPKQSPTPAALRDIEDTARRFLDSPIRAPYKDKFAELGRRAQQLGAWINLARASPHPEDRRRLGRVIEATAESQFPFLRGPPRDVESPTPLADLVASFERGSRGIVIPTGSRTLRFAFHAVAAIREVLKSTLPIEIAFAGDGDLPPSDRERLRSRFESLRFLDVSAVFDDATLRLGDGGWAIKPFAALASPFEQVILVDADVVFLQDPENLLAQKAYLLTGALLFHDRLLWKGRFRDRHEWWGSQITDPSAALSKSLVWAEGYAEEGDSGVVVADKSRAGVLAGLLHVAWQNTREVREEVTYRLTHGDKESWWLGLELAGSGYAFEEHYAAMVGWLWEGTGTGTGGGGDAVVCSFVVGHLDEGDRLLWYNGGLLKNKRADPVTFEVPTHWMVDGEWRKGRRKKDMSCMVGREALELDAGEKEVLGSSIRLAQEIDAQFGFGTKKR